MVSWFRIRREWLLLVTVKGSRLWLLDGFSRLRLASDISLTASCPVLWFGSGLFLSGAVSWFFVVKSLRLTPKFSFHSQDVAMASTQFLARFVAAMEVVSLALHRSVTVISSRSSLGASYSGDDTRVPGIRGNEENLTVLWSSSMVENECMEEKNHMSLFSRVQCFVTKVVRDLFMLNLFPGIYIYIYIYMCSKTDR
ncbi:hypothetical protein YC2023_114587 [Brassica napus]